MSTQDCSTVVNQLKHDARKPLVLIIQTSQLLLSGVEGELSAQICKDVEAMHISAYQALEAVDDLIALHSNSLNGDINQKE